MPEESDPKIYLTESHTSKNSIYLLILFIFLLIFIVVAFLLVYKVRKQQTNINYSKNNTVAKISDEPASGSSTNSASLKTRFVDEIQYTKIVSVSVKSINKPAIDVEDSSKKIFSIPLNLISTSSAYLKFKKDEVMILSITSDQNNKIQAVKIISRR